MKIIAVTTLYDAVCKDSAVSGAIRMKLLINNMLHWIAAYILEGSRFMGHIFGIIFKLQYLYSSKILCVMQVEDFTAGQQLNKSTHF
jgi:hypothetical protein